MPTRPATDMPARIWTSRDLLTWMRGHFERTGLDSPRLVAEHLLSHVLGCERMRLYMEVDRPAAASELATLRDLVARAARHEPVQYLVGRWGFFGREYRVDRSTLIPRPSTETLVEKVIEWCRGRTGPLEIADLGTGTGCVAISLATQLPDARLLATDIVPEAIDLARANAERNGVSERIDFRLGATWDPIDDSRGLDVVCSNPPYVSDAEWEDVEANVREYEPATALRAGPDGLDVIRPIIADAASHLVPGGLLALETGDGHHDQVLELVAAAGLVNGRGVRDLEGFRRVVLAEAPGERDSGIR